MISANLTMTTSRSLLLTGATGFVGGTVLSTFLNSQLEAIKSLQITALVRTSEQSQALADKGVASVILEGGLDDVKGLSLLASKYDIVVHCASGYHKPSALALIEGLGRRRKEHPGNVVPVYVHLTGTTNICVGDATGRGGKLVTFSDNQDKQSEIYEYESQREKDDPYIQRTTDTKVVETGESLGIKTFTIMAPPVIGLGTGFFKNRSEQIPLLVNNAIKEGQAEWIKPGTSTSGVVHVTDLGLLIEAVVKQVILEPSLPSGKQGYFFASTGYIEWREVAEAIAKVGHKLGLFKTDKAVLIDLSAAAKFCDGDEVHAERILASSSSTKTERGYGIGWKPKASPIDWESYIAEEIEAIQRVHPLFEFVTGTWQYIVADAATARAVIIDPVLNYDPLTMTASTEAADSILALLHQNGYKVDMILETHAHADHLTAASYLQATLATKTGHKPILGIGSRIREVQKLFGKRYGIDVEEYEHAFDKLWKDDEEFAVGDLTAQAIHLPGHTPDHMGYKIGGDSIFNVDIGSARADFPGGSAEAIYNSGRKILSLPEHTKIWVGHDYPPEGRGAPVPYATVSQQRRENRHLKDGTPEHDFVKMRKERDQTLAAPKLLHPSLQINIRGGRLPKQTNDGQMLLHLPLVVSGSTW
ncbi:Glyoxylase B2 [Paramyrothecium foliicola]|nr:Glyoxylase B2 [Paramyrothecium foliicola]